MLVFMPHSDSELPIYFFAHVAALYTRVLPILYTVYLFHKKNIVQQESIDFCMTGLDINPCKIGLLFLFMFENGQRSSMGASELLSFSNSKQMSRGLLLISFD